jgi:DNA polymerase-3 subunit gamma/tau
MSALYHKHRPQLFSALIGQEHIAQTITSQIRLNKPAHAYLFCGPRGVGKTTAARLLAKALNCQNRKEGEFEPCGECESCQEISASRAIDVIEIDAASHTGVDNVRENIIENAQFKPTKSPYKIFIIDEVHMLSTSAFNALLKTLEEPPHHVIFILATTEAHKLLETIISRCQKFDFKKVPYELMKKHLERIGKEEDVKIDKEVIDRIIAKSDGCVRDAMSLLDQLMATGEKKITLETASLVLPASSAEDALTFITALTNQDANAAFNTLKNLADQGVRFDYFATDTVKLLRVIMILKISPLEKSVSLDLSAEAKKEIDNILIHVTPSEIVRLIDLIMKRAEEIDTAPIPQLPLEMAVVEWTSENPKSKIQNPKFDEQKKERGNNTTSSSSIPPLLGERRGEGSSEPKGLVEKVKELISKDPICTIEEVRDKWSQFLTKVEGHSTSLVFILKMAEIKGVSGSVIQLAVQYPFHCDKLQEKTCQKKVEEILSEILGKKARIEVILNEKKDETASSDLQDLAAALGGEVVL